MSTGKRGMSRSLFNISILWHENMRKMEQMREIDKYNQCLARYAEVNTI